MKLNNPNYNCWLTVTSNASKKLAPGMLSTSYGFVVEPGCVL